MGTPLVLEQAGIGVEVAESRGVGWAGCVGAVFGVGAIVVLRPDSVKDESGVRGAFGGSWMRVAEFRRPGEVEEVVVEAGAGGDVRVG